MNADTKPASAIRPSSAASAAILGGMLGMGLLATFAGGKWAVKKQRNANELEGMENWKRSQLYGKLREQEDVITEQLALGDELRRRNAELEEKLSALVAECGRLGKQLGESCARSVVAKLELEQAERRARDVRG